MARVFYFLIMFLMAGMPLSAAEEARVNVHSFSVPQNDGKTVSLADYKGKALLIVNTASRCGFTSQYAGMEELYQLYKDKGLVVLAFPANNFMGQEPGTDDEIKNFCEIKYKTSFPLFAKSSVKGPDITGLFKYLTEESAFKGPVTWNFNKFLVDANGHVVARFESRVKPMDPELVAAVEKTLPR
jgi:glutathione peroxidase